MSSRINDDKMHERYFILENIFLMKTVVEYLLFLIEFQCFVWIVNFKLHTSLSFFLFYFSRITGMLAGYVSYKVSRRTVLILQNILFNFFLF